MILTLFVVGGSWVNKVYDALFQLAELVDQTYASIGKKYC